MNVYVMSNEELKYSLCGVRDCLYLKNMPSDDLDVLFWEKPLSPRHRILIYSSSPLEVSLSKVVVKICSILTGEHPCRSAISLELLRVAL